VFFVSTSKQGEAFGFVLLLLLNVIVVVLVGPLSWVESNTLGLKKV
jgi:hypothetical protein